MKYIAIPADRYESMMTRLKGGNNFDVDEGLNLKKDVAAIVTNQENQELIQRKNEYKDANEEIPKTLDKKIPQTATTLIPPPNKKKKSSAATIEKPKRMTKSSPKKVSKLKKQPIVAKKIIFANERPPKTFHKWKFYEA